ncbi:MAG: flagellar basal body rod C-terminal domain-containing protein [Candidatus Sericytochromatia bacterium]
MGSFDHGFAGMASLRAINQWIGVINSNLGGANRTAYKSTKVSFTGLVSRVDRDPRSDINGLQFPDTSLAIGFTRVDFAQGTIVQDGELTHLALSGDGFFAITTGGPATVAGNALTYRNDIFFTRDGEFRWTVIGTNTILTTAGGLTVLGRDGNEIRRIGNGTTFSVTTTTVTGANNCVGIFRFVNNQALKFSKYGSTVFDAAQAGVIAQITDAEILQSALESSNSSLSDTLPELSLAQKMFSAISKIINVNNEDLDVCINLIR